MQNKDKEAIHQVCRLIDQSKAEIVSFLQEYVKIKSIDRAIALPSESGDVKTCQEWLYNQLEKFKCFENIDYWEEEKDEPNIVANVKGSEEKDEKSLMFNGHSDVVPVTEDQLTRWTGPPPWEGKIKDGLVWGRGACDMKGGNTAFIWAAKLLNEAGITLQGDCILSIVIGEEPAFHQIGCDSVLDRGYSAPLILNAEPTNLEICPAAMGLFFFKLQIPGKSAHYSSRGKSVNPIPYGEEIPGINAIDKAILFLQAFSNLEKNWRLYRKHPLVPPGGMTLNPSLIKGGEYIAALADSCEITYGVLFNPGLSFTEVSNEIKEEVKRITASDYWLNEHPPSLELPYILPPFEPYALPIDHFACKILGKSMEEAVGHEAIFSCFPGVCDANFMALKGGTVIICGPGSLSMGCHGADEYIPVNQVINACKLYATLMINWCKVA